MSLVVGGHSLVEVIFLDKIFGINAGWAAQCHKPRDHLCQINPDAS